MRRRFLTLLSAASLLLCVASAVLWSRSWHRPAGDEDRVSWLSDGDRQTVRSAAGRATWFAPPADVPDAPRTADGQTPWEVAGRIRNEDLEWHAFGPDEEVSRPSWVGCWPRGPSAELEADTRTHNRPPPRVPPAAWSRPLLRALEDPARFVAAHNGLVEQFPQLVARRYWRTGAVRQPDWTIAADMDGLPVVLRWESAMERAGGTLWSTYDTAATVDPAHLPAVRDRWHRRLDVPVASAPWWAVAGAFAVPPAVRASVAAGRLVARRRRRRVGLCPTCGYDLRATPERCPECGAATGG